MTNTARRDNALRHIRKGVNTPAYQNARRILIVEFHYTEADLLRVAKLAAR